MARRFVGKSCSALLAVAVISVASGALAAIAPWYPRDGDDSCKVLAGAEPRIDVPPPPWQVSILRPPGWVGQDPRVYTVPPVLDCRGESPHRKSGWACAPSFLPWAKRNCAGLEIRQ